MCSFTAVCVPCLAKIPVLLPWQSVGKQNIAGPSSLWKILQQMLLNLSWVLFCYSPNEWGDQHRSVRNNVSGNGDGKKYRETACGWRILCSLKENGRAGTCKTRRENHIKRSLFIELLYIICVNERLWDFLQFLLRGFLVGFTLLGKPWIKKCPFSLCIQPPSCCDSGSWGDGS